MLAFRQMQIKRAKEEGTEVPAQPMNPLSKFFSSLNKKK
jgi:hypothetical protein